MRLRSLVSMAATTAIVAGLAAAVAATFDPIMFNSCPCICM